MQLAATTILSAISSWFQMKKTKKKKKKKSAVVSVKEVLFVLYDQQSMAVYKSSFGDITKGLKVASPFKKGKGKGSK